MSKSNIRISFPHRNRLISIINLIVKIWAKMDSPLKNHDRVKLIDWNSCQEDNHGSDCFEVGLGPYADAACGG